MNVQDIKSQSAIIYTDIRTYSGYKKLTPEDFIENGVTDLPPPELVQLGQERLCPRDLLRPPLAVKRATERLLLKKGARLMGSVLIHADNIEWAVDNLTENQQKFYDYMPELKKRYMLGVMEWASQFPKYRKAILKKAPDVEDVISRYRYNFTIYRIGDIEDQSAITEDAKVDNAFQGIYHDTIEDVCQYLRDHLHGDLDKEDRRITSRTLKSFDAISEKLSSLSFVDYRFSVLCDHINETLASMPDGRIEGTSLVRIASLQKMLSTPGSIKELVDQLSG